MNIVTKREEKNGEIIITVSAYENKRLVRKVGGTFSIKAAEKLFEEFGTDILTLAEESFKRTLERMSKI